MIGTQPMYELAPLDYRYAMDAALTMIDPSSAAVCCKSQALQPTLQNRLPQASSGIARSGLWIEPSAQYWRDEFSELVARLDSDSRLVVIMSMPLAWSLPPHGKWSALALGTRPRGLTTLLRWIQEHRFVIEACYGVHTSDSIAHNMLAQAIDRIGRPELADRQRAAARFRYCLPQSAARATVVLISARRQVAR